jgi:hypothetical protein
MLDRWYIHYRIAPQLFKPFEWFKRIKTENFITLVE